MLTDPVDLVLRSFHSKTLLYAFQTWLNTVVAIVARTFVDDSLAWDENIAVVSPVKNGVRRSSPDDQEIRKKSQLLVKVEFRWESEKVSWYDRLIHWSMKRRRKLYVSRWNSMQFGSEFSRLELIIFCFFKSCRTKIKLAMYRKWWSSNFNSFEDFWLDSLTEN